MGWLSKTTEKPEDANTVSSTDAGQYDIPSDDFLRDIARLKGHAPVKAEKVDASVVYPVSAAIAKEEASRQKAEAEKAIPGMEIAGEGIFLGQYTPKDREGNSLGKTFNVYAAKEDLTDASGKKETYKYVDAVKRIAALKGWNGHDGTNYATDKELYKALKDGTYNGGWIIPTRDLLGGTDVDGNKTQSDNLYAHKDKGALKGTFCMVASSGSGYPDWYWSSTEDRDYSSYVHSVRFSDGSESWLNRDNSRLSCRPVRLVEVLNK